MAMTNNQIVAQRLRAVLTQAGGMGNPQISQAITGELKESDVENRHGAVVAALAQGNGAHIPAVMDQQLNGYAAWNPGTNQYDWGPNMPFVAKEDVNATRRWAGQGNFDAAKALTNLLRLIKALER